MAFPILYIFSLLFLYVVLVFGNVNLSSTLSTNDNVGWLSPSGEFTFGFRQLNGTNLFMVAIWYNKIPEKTIVWNANAENPAPTGSQIQLTSQGLMLTSPEGESIWSTQPKAVVSYGAMLDTGNFVLVNKSSTFVWESFKNPTDTLLPNQSLQLDGNLTSQITKTNYTSGRFQLYFQNGIAMLSPLAWPTQLRYKSYYSIDAPDSASQLVFDELGNIYVQTPNGTRIQPQGPKWGNLVLDPKVYYYRATLDYYGVFTQYAHPRDTKAQQGWTIVRYVPDNICIAIFNDMGSGSCGYNSYCSMENQIPTCKCPDGYSLVDPGNEFGGCQPNFTFGCGADNDERLQARAEDLYKLTTLRYVDWPLSDYEKMQPYSQQDCQQSCLHDCMCAVAIFNNETCWKKRLPLANGRAQSGSQLALIKTRVAPLGNNIGPSTSPDSKKEDRVKPILQGRIDALVENDEEALSDYGRLQQWIKIAIWCIQEHHETRPTMRMVVLMLEGLLPRPGAPSPLPLVATIASHFQSSQIHNLIPPTFSSTICSHHIESIASILESLAVIPRPPL
ncbi:Bulb-type lectin domain [Sesbania bispinosa]|nr:Bulb-type lectin domain [Sesbania bispinosa]